MGKEKAQFLHFIKIKPTLLLIIPFLTLYIITLFQGWPNIYVFTFPLLTLFGALFFLIFDKNIQKMNIKHPLIHIKFYPFGQEMSRYALIFGGSAFIQQFVVLLLGIEAKNRPQLLNEYGYMLFITLVVLYILPWAWVSIEIISNNQIIFLKDGQRSQFQLSQGRTIKYILIVLITLTPILILFLVDSVGVGLFSGVFQKAIYHLPGSNSIYPIEADPTINLSVISIFVLILNPLLLGFISSKIYSIFRKVAENFLIKARNAHPRMTDEEYRANKLLIKNFQKK